MSTITIHGHEEIERWQRELAEFRRKDEFAMLVERYQNLLQYTQRVLNDNEEARDSRDKYKQLVKNQDKNPFALVLVDGDGYVFHENVMGKGDTGRNAAQLLHNTVRTSLQTKGLENCAVVVRVYANVAGLSKALAKAGLLGHEARSLAPFIASFNRSYDLTEMIDAGDLKENADYKVKSLLRFYADIPQCKHIYFAACHDVGYVNELTAHMGDRTRFTLLRSPGIKFHDEFRKLDLPIEELPGVFRTTPIDTSYRSTTTTGGPRNEAAPSPGPVNGKHSPYSSSTSPPVLYPTGNQVSSPPSKICPFHRTGTCKFGDKCKNAHPEPHASRVNHSWLLNHNDNNHNNMQNRIFKPDFSRLPQKWEMPDGEVPLNANDHRLDSYCPRPPDNIMDALNARHKVKKLCNKFHLENYCSAGPDCEYDHAPLENSLKTGLEFLARSMPCGRRGLCRNGLCTQGHICQLADCKHRGGRAFCKIPHNGHAEVLSVARYVPASQTHPHAQQKQHSRGVSSVDDSADASTDAEEVSPGAD